ncbi:MAG TPA: hypothetical protein VKY51_02875 [Fredinandcohnia sp.]|nr:hypothetical protein [Fredinandcohnia sp.]
MKTSIPLQSWSLALLAALALACSESTTPDGAGGSGPAGSGGSGGEVGTGGTGGDGGNEIVIPIDEIDTGWEPQVPDAIDEEIPADPRPESCDAEFDWIAKVRGWIVAPGGKPLPGAAAQACIYAADGAYLCLAPSFADEEGVYTIEIPENLRCIREVAMRVSHFPGHRASSYCPLEGGDDPVVRIEMPAVLPFAMPTEDLPPLGDPDAARTVSMHDGLEIEVTPSKILWGDFNYEILSGRRIPTDAVGLCGGAADFDGLYAFFPESPLEAPGFPFTIANATGLPAGKKVTFYVLGGLECALADGTAVPEGTWAPFGEGTISEDGATISTDPGVGLPCLNWLGYQLMEEP